MSGRITMTQLAELAGVSKITVSRALRDSHLVRAEVRARIKALAREHGYLLNVAARNLRLRKTSTVAVVVEMNPAGERPMSEPILLLLLGGLLEELTPAGYDVLLTTRDHLAVTETVSADGLILLGQGNDRSMTDRIIHLGLPAVVWGAQRPDLGLVVVGSDNRCGGGLATEHLVATGRRRIVFLGDTHHPEVRDRFEGLRDVLTASEGILVEELSCPFARRAGEAALSQLVQEGIEFDAVFAASDAIAAGAYDALVAAGISVPEQVAIVGYDDTTLAADHRPPLSSVRQQWRQGGQLLARALLDQLAGRPAEPVAMPVELIARESSRGRA